MVNMLICTQGQIGLRKFKHSFPKRSKIHYLSMSVALDDD